MPSAPVYDQDFDKAKRNAYTEIILVYDDSISIYDYKKCGDCHRYLSLHRKLCSLTKNELLASSALHKNGLCNGCGFGIGRHK
jgi:hypothetical protein